MEKRVLACMLGTFLLMVSVHGEPLVINDDDDSSAGDGQGVKTREIADSDKSTFESVGHPLARREFFDLNKLLQRRQTSGFTTVQVPKADAGRTQSISNSQLCTISATRR
jgi:hypothetical protein